jgi:hypothetical protein
MARRDGSFGAMVFSSARVPASGPKQQFFVQARAWRLLHVCPGLAAGRQPVRDVNGDDKVDLGDAVGCVALGEGDLQFAKATKAMAAHLARFFYRMGGTQEHEKRRVEREKQFPLRKAAALDYRLQPAT